VPETKKTSSHWPQPILASKPFNAGNLPLIIGDDRVAERGRLRRDQQVIAADRPTIPLKASAQATIAKMRTKIITPRSPLFGSVDDELPRLVCRNQREKDRLVVFLQQLAGCLTMPILFPKLPPQNAVVLLLFEAFTRK
jgi:hypothetical protein